MTCDWESLLVLLPHWLRQESMIKNGSNVNEIRLRVGLPVEIVTGPVHRLINRKATSDDIAFCINSASKYSPWSAATSASGYITSSGGHRVGICGEAVMKEGIITGIKNVTSVSIRVARDCPGMAKSIAPHCGSILILGAPGSGKTTLLRDLARILSKDHTVGVVDERGELFPSKIPRGNRMDILTGIPKPQGMEIMLRTMTPEYIAVDEITSTTDIKGFVHAAFCGCALLATAHAGNKEEFYSRAIYQSLLDQRIFDWIVELKQDYSYTVGRAKSCHTNCLVL